VLTEAAAHYQRAVDLDPNFAIAYNNLGNVFRSLGRLDSALLCYERALALSPNIAEFHNNLGNTLKDQGKMVEARSCYERAVGLNHNLAHAHYNLANLDTQENSLSAAVQHYEEAIRLQPDVAEFHLNLGNAFQKQDKVAEAIVQYQRALQLKPDLAQGYTNVGGMLARLGRLEEARQWHSRAIALAPDFADAHWNEALCLLTLEQFDRGWHQHEWRKRVRACSIPRSYSQPLWSGREPIAGKILFIHWEQGLGDTLQFCRYAKLARDLGARVILSVQNSLRRLLQTLGPDIEVIGADEDPDYFDFHCAVMSLPLAFGTGLDNIPRQVPYLAADARSVSAWRHRMKPLTRPRVGLCWAGDPSRRHPDMVSIDARRSIALSQLGPLTSVAGVSFISLQKGVAAGQLADREPGVTIHDWSDEMVDFADTAAVIDALDLVITVDTSFAHAAGALGKPVWILNRFDSCWRWLRDRTDSPWYPSALLWRQPRAGDWDTVIDAVAVALQNLTRESNSVPVGNSSLQ
jgi:tetratricopeptide (TPR) repeat protein